MDEDHSRIRNTNDGSSLLGVPWETAATTAATTPSRSPPASPPRALAAGGVFPPDRGGWSGGVDPGYFADAPRHPPPSSSPNDNNDPGSFSPGGGRGERGAAGAAGEGGWGGEMLCVDSVDLGDVLEVRQEESAPEQVGCEKSFWHHLSLFYLESCILWGRQSASSKQTVCPSL